jgi:hypothetical protein
MRKLLGAMAAAALASGLTVSPSVVYACAGKVANQKGFPNAHFLWTGTYAPNGNGTMTPRFGLNGGIAIAAEPGNHANDKSVVQAHTYGSLLNIVDKCPDIP